MKILITGNMGYIGPCVVQQLRSSYPGASIVGYDMGYFADCLTNASILPECRVDVQYFSDVRSLPGSIIQGADAIVYLAAISNDPMGNTYAAPTFDINCRAAVDLATKARDRGVRNFVYASSCSMYGSADDSPRTENSPLNPLTAYARSKVTAEKELSGLSSDGFTVTSLRFSTACGMSERLRLDLVLNDFVACAIASGKITILSDGTPWRPLIHIRDMARAIDWAVGRDAGNGGEFLAVNVGSDAWNYQVRALAEAVAAAIPGVEVSVNRNAQPDRRSYRVSFERFRSLAPFHQPVVDLAAAIAELRDGLEAMGFRDGDFRNSRFMRLKVLSQLRTGNLLNENLEWTTNTSVVGVSG